MPDPPAITAVEFIKQVIDVVSEQVTSLDGEIYKASGGDTGLVRAADPRMRSCGPCTLMEGTISPLSLSRSVHFPRSRRCSIA